MALMNLRRDTPPAPNALATFLDGVSIEVMPRTAAGIEDFRALLPAGTRVYIAHIDGTPIDDMVACAARLRREGFEPMPHFPARLIASKAVLLDWINRYKGEAGIEQALLLGGGVNTPAGDYTSALQMMESGAFDGFTRLHIAGHPEGNRDIDADGGDRIAMEALRLKQDWAARSDAKMAIVTQFCFEAEPVIAWVDKLARLGIQLPVHIGVAGPAKLQTLVKYAIACGVGPSLRVLQRRARDVTKLLMPFGPGDLLRALAAHKTANPSFGIESVHFFPLGGIKATATWVAEHNKGETA
ncbi:methylenetetrahydrofolate reductase [Phaeovulum sp.]|uniref:methylenetetrahydrofolate reductase n=1 Tax=Phaeovulum sp. TaxID=2934796 RepID=UPI003567B5EF